MVTKIPVAGVVWQTLHYLIGFRRLGFEPYYVEAHARTPSMLMTHADEDGAALAASFIDRIMRRFDLSGQWAYHALHDDGRCYGLSDRELFKLYRDAELIINLHGGTAPLPDHSRTGRLIYVETDPVQLQVELQHGVPETIQFLEEHCAFFTFGENWGRPDCALVPTARFEFRPTRQPVVIELWPAGNATTTPCFTTVGSWRQYWRDVTIAGRLYTWSKHVEFEKYLQLPTRTRHAFELALSGCEEDDVERLVEHGWKVTDATAISADLDRYRDYITGSYAEFTVAKEQNVALRSGWFSDRSATYLAAGRPVVTQDTGFANVLPTGRGLHAFSTLDEAAAAVEAIGRDYELARRGAREVALEYFSSDVVLGQMLETVGVSTPRRAPIAGMLAPDLRLTPVSRRPLRLPEETLRRIARAPTPFGRSLASITVASVVVTSHDNLPLTRLCIESVLENTEQPAFELIVVDNGSRDGSRVYLRTVERRFRQVKVVLNDTNRGFPEACNEGLALARGRLLVMLNNDTIVAPQWLARLEAHTADPEIGLVGPVTNRIGNEAEVEVHYDTYAGFLEHAARRTLERSGEKVDIRMPAMFCLALRRDVFARLGPLDTGFGLGTLEDDDYAERARRRGYRTVCAEDVLVHHFSEGSFGKMFRDGGYAALLTANRRRFEEKWGKPWEPYARRQSTDYEALRQRVRELVGHRLPAHATIIVASRGDVDLLTFPEHEGWHFPQTPDGTYAGHYPADSAEAVEQLERLRAQGGQYLVLPRTSLWWLEHYREFGVHLAERYCEVIRDEACVVFSLEAA
jgi:GT2 family glycosyltransferase